MTSGPDGISACEPPLRETRQIAVRKLKGADDSIGIASPNYTAAVTASPKANKAYGQWLNYTWVVDAPLGYAVEVQLDDFDIDVLSKTQRECAYASRELQESVRVYARRSGTYKLVSELCYGGRDVIRIDPDAAARPRRPNEQPADVADDALLQFVSNGETTGACRKPADGSDGCLHYRGFRATIKTAPVSAYVSALSTREFCAASSLFAMGSEYFFGRTLFIGCH